MISFNVRVPMACIDRDPDRFVSLSSVDHAICAIMAEAQKESNVTAAHVEGMELVRSFFRQQVNAIPARRHGV